MYSGPPARESSAKSSTIPNAIARRRRNERVVSTLEVVLVTSALVLIPPPGTPHRLGKVAHTDPRLPPQGGIRPEGRQMLFTEHHVPQAVDEEPPHGPANATCKSQLARRIQEEQNAIAHLIALAAGPQANPLKDGEIASGAGPADAALHAESDGHNPRPLIAGNDHPRNRSDGSGKDDSRGTRNLRKPDGTGRPGDRTRTRGVPPDPLRGKRWSNAGT